MAGKRVSKIFKGFIIILNSIVAFLFIIACLVPYLNPADWWFMGFFGLMFPYLAILLIFFTFFWWVFKPKYSLLPIITLLIGWKQLSVLLAVNKLETFSVRKNISHVRILNWNIRSLEGVSEKSEIKKKDRATIPETIIAQRADIVCLQEFNTSSMQDNIGPFLKQYPYYFFSKDFKRKTPKNYESGSIIFSKHPIIDSGKVEFPGVAGESLIYADVKLKDTVIRVFTTHLQSFKFKKEDYEDIEKLKKNAEPQLPASLIQKMKRAFTQRGHQAEIVREALDRSPYPSIITGDFNDVPNSFTYFHIRNSRQDAFLATSLGIGRTYLALAPTLRIDYILPDSNFVIHQFDMVDEVLSDHLMLVSDVSLK